MTRKKQTERGDPRGVFFDLFDADEATELSMRAELLRGLQAWVSEAGIQAEAAKKLGIAQSRVSNIARGKIDNFSLDLLVRLAARAGLRPQLKLAA
jgi:predicted XRE-type DNA-binding protein